LLVISTEYPKLFDRQSCLYPSSRQI